MVSDDNLSAASKLSETEREVIRIKAAQSGIDSVILYVERVLQARLQGGDA